MTPEQFRAVLDDLGLTRRATAALFGVSNSTVDRWVAGDREIPGTVRLLIYLIGKHEPDAQKLLAEVLEKKVHAPY